MSKHNPQQAVNKAVEAINEAITRAKEIADKYELDFTISPAYGMGGTYYSPGALRKDKEHWEANGTAHYAILENYSYYVSEEEGGWVSSSMEC